MIDTAKMTSIKFLFLLFVNYGAIASQWIYKENSGGTWYLYKVKPKNFEQENVLESGNSSHNEHGGVLIYNGKLRSSSLLLISEDRVLEFENMLQGYGIKYSSKGPTLIESVRVVEDLIDIRPIQGTDLLTGISYRFLFRDYGQAPIIYKTTDARLNQQIMFAERRQSEWPKYLPGGERELEGVYMFIPSEYPHAYEIVNLGILKQDSTMSAFLLRATPNPCPVEFCAYLRSEELRPFLWLVKEKGPGLYQIENVRTLAYVPANDHAYIGSILNPTPSEETRTLFNMKLAGAGLLGKIISFEFEDDPGQISNRTKEVTMINRNDIINNSSSVITQTVTATKEVSNTFTFGFSQSLKVFHKVSAEAGIPLLGQVQTETGIEAGFEARQELSSTTTHTFEIKQEIPVQPFTRIHVNGIVTVADNVVLKFRSKIKVTMNINRLTTHGRQVVPRAVPVELVEEYLKVNKVEGTIIEHKGNTLILEVAGTVHGTFGIDTILHVHEFPL